jgi:hypothetical protein
MQHRAKNSNYRQNLTNLVYKLQACALGANNINNNKIIIIITIAITIIVIPLLWYLENGFLLPNINSDNGINIDITTTLNM